MHWTKKVEKIRENVEELNKMLAYRHEQGTNPKNKRLGVQRSANRGLIQLYHGDCCITDLRAGKPDELLDYLAGFKAGLLF